MVYHTHKLQTNEIELRGNANIHMKIDYKNMEIKVVYRFGTVMKSALIPMDHGSKSSVPTITSQANTFGNPKQDRETPSGVLL